MHLPGFTVQETLGRARGRYASTSIGGADWLSPYSFITNHPTAVGYVSPAGLANYIESNSNAASQGIPAGPVCPPQTVCCEYDGESRTCIGGCCSKASACCPDGKPGTGNRCANLLADPNNCGRCDNVCGNADRCVAGVCTQRCPSGQTQCGNTCVDLTRDPQNCGACGHACPNGTICQNSSCACAPPTCTWSEQNGTGVLKALVCTAAGSSQFTASLTRSSTLSSPGVGEGFESHLLVQRLRAPGSSTTTSLQIDTQTSPNSAPQVALFFGDGFNGVKQIALTTPDRATMQGTINGRVIAPFPIHADPTSIRFADGSPIPPTALDSEISQALPVLLQAIQRQCPQETESFTPVVRPFAADQPAHAPNFDQAPCILCTLKATAGEILCEGQAVGSAAVCGPAYPVCLGAEWALCALAYLDFLGNTCHLSGTPGGTAGPPCCPVPCGGGGCCGPGESCAGPSLNPFAPNLCCSAGLTPCDRNCCGTGETCLGNSTCCPSANVCGGQNCCSTGETCLPNGSCCAPGNVCGGQNCCGAGEICLPNGSCCPVGRAVCGGNCCPNPFDVCDPATNQCTIACPGGAQPCGGTCCAAGQLCCFNSDAIAMQCITPLGPVDGLTWCGARNVRNLQCSNCAPGQQCAPLCKVGLCSDELYCQ